ncbi:MAG TPA: PBP1A family penicillin-binding protein [Bacteroidetes bacterium]|nr:PBP1A family penicillin-binding protein [Bacteroidota bacterium]
MAMKRVKKTNNRKNFLSSLWRAARQNPRRVLRWAGILLLVLFAAYMWRITRDLPSLTQLEVYEPELATRIYSLDGKLIKELFFKKRALASLDEMPDYMWQAVVATEDHRFFHHWGLVPARILKAMFVDLVTLSKRQGASTITQQLARQLYFGTRKRVDRKIKEILTAIQIERTYTKPEILEMYLNHMYLGHGTYGVRSAARFYFGKDISQLSLDECALLAGLFQRPEALSPIRHPDRAKRRRDLVLYRMWKVGYITKEQYEEARAKPIVLAKPEDREALGIAPYFTEYVRQKLQNKYGQAIYKDGLTVYTTLDTRVQAAAEKAARWQLARMQRKVNKRLIRTGKWKELVTKEDLGDRTYRQALADTAWLDSVLTEKAPVQTAVVALNPTNGYILAMIGGRDFSKSKFNRATQAKRQPGSAFKPFVYTAAVDNGYMPTYELLNQPVVLFMPDGTRWAPHNYDGSQGGPTTLREGLRRSLNLVAARLVQEVVRPQIVVDYAHKLGITTDLPAVDAIALGACEVIPLEITAAYAALDNHGVYSKPIAILRVMDRFGNILEENVPKRREVLRAGTAYIMTDMLETVINAGTGVSARTRWGFTRPAAGKTGTTNDFTDAWFVGYTPQIAAGVWVGFDDPSMTLGPGNSGAVAALPIWARMMKTAHDTLNLPVVDFEMPDDVVRLDVCAESKKIATPYCPKVLHEVFLKEYAPTDTCTIHTGGTRHRGRKTHRPIL